MKHKDSDMIYLIVRRTVLKDRRDTMCINTMDSIRNSLRWWVIMILDNKVTDFSSGWKNYDFLKSRVSFLDRLEVTSRILEEL